MSRSRLGFEFRVLFRERVAIEPILNRFDKEVLKPRGLTMTGSYVEEWTGYITGTHDRTVHDNDRQNVFRWFKAQPDVVKCTVDLPSHVKVRDVRELILSLV